MQLIWSLLGLVIIAYIWIWVFTNYFSQKFDKSTLVKAIVFSSLVAMLLFVYHLLPSFFWQKMSIDQMSYRSLIIFWLYCLSFILLFSIQMKNLKYSGIKKMLIVVIVFFVLIWIGWISTWISSVLMYYFISVYAEEILKFSVGENVSLDSSWLSQEWQGKVTQSEAKSLEIRSMDSSALPQNDKVGGEKDNTSSWQTSNLIFISILVGLGFSMVETVLYLVNTYIIWSGSLLALSISRGLFAGLLHLSATGLVAYFVARNRARLFSGFMVWIIAGFWLHLVYNLSLYYHIMILTVGILIACYFILSYLLFNSDIVYQEE